MTPPADALDNHASIFSPISQIARAQAAEAASQAQDAIGTMGAQLVRGEVVATDPLTGTVQIRRYTAINDDGTPGGADPAFYPSVAAALPKVGSEVFAIGNTGGLVILGEVLSDTIPIGSVQPYAGDADPEGGRWLIADGRALVAADYPAYTAAIGNKYGGDGTTAVNLPDLRDRVPIGASATYALGQTVGEANHTLTIGELPPHDHDGVTASDSHSHTTTSWAYNLTTDDFAQPGSGNSYVSSWSTDSGTDSDSHSHTLSSEGDGVAHNNLQPSLALNYIVRCL